MNSDPTLLDNQTDTNERPAPHSAEDLAYHKILRQFVTEAARLMEERHCEQVMAIDVRGLSQITHYLLIGTGTSDRQMHAVAEELKILAQTYELDRLGQDVDAQTSWLVLDLLDVIVHLFEEQTRVHYDLEMLWEDAPKIDFHAKD